MTSPTTHVVDNVRATVPTGAAGPVIVPASGQPGATTILEALTDISPVLVTVYLVARLIIPALLITVITREAPATQRIALLRDYLRTTTHSDYNHGDR